MTEEVKEPEGKVEEKPVEKVEEKPAESQAKQYNDQEQTALGFGWMPKEEWEKAGHDAEDWVPAKHFLKFGELKTQLISKDKQVTKQDKIIKMMKDHHLRVKQTAYEEALKSLKAERKQALEENDIATAERLRDQMDEIKEQQAKDRALPQEVEKELQEVEPPAPAVHPEFHTWHSKNPWYIPDNKKQDEVSQTADQLGIAIVNQARANGKQITVKELYEQVTTKIKRMYPEKFGTPKSPQESSPQSSGKGDNKSSVKLTDEQLAVAKNFGLTPEKYAEQLKSYKGR